MPACIPACMHACCMHASVDLGAKSVQESPLESVDLGREVLETGEVPACMPACMPHANLGAKKQQILCEPRQESADFGREVLERCWREVLARCLHACFMHAS